MKKITVFIILVLAILAIRIFVLEPKKNPSGAMAPSILAGDYLLVYRWPFGHYKLAGIKGRADLSSLTRGDVITFKYPKKPAVEFIKRLIGLPGDTITYKDKRLIINGEIIRDVYDKDLNYTDRVLGPLKVKQYRELLKNRSYTIQLIAEKNHPSTELKKTITVPAGQYFVLGDNRDLSNDSRHFGFVAAAAITGKVAYIYFSRDQRKQDIRWQRIGLKIK